MIIPNPLPVYSPQLEIYGFAVEVVYHDTRQCMVFRVVGYDFNDEPVDWWIVEDVVYPLDVDFVEGAENDN